MEIREGAESVENKAQKKDPSWGPAKGDCEATLLGSSSGIRSNAVPAGVRVAVQHVYRRLEYAAWPFFPASMEIPVHIPDKLHRFHRLL